MSVKKLQSSTQTYLSGIIDYAGLFPPAQLSLDEAIRNYAAYQQHADAWMLGRFVVPVGRIMELEAYLHLFSADRPLDLSVTGRPAADTATWFEQLHSDMKNLNDFTAEHSDLVTASMLELPLPQGIPEASFFKKAAEAISAQLFFEVTTPLHSGDWAQHVTGTLDRISEYNRSAEQKIGFKLRMGGVTAEAFPTVEQAAFVLKACSDRNIPQKFTAGLHHPVRMYRGEVQAEMHGFLNVFTASMLSRIHHLEQNEIAYILGDQNASHFPFQIDGTGWKDLHICTEEIRQLRMTALYSFGSCSFDEPREDLQALRLL